MARSSIFDFAGGQPAFLALATAHHRRCLDDPELSHPFSHGVHAEHVERLASYWGEVFGGPPTFSQSMGGHSAMLRVHACEEIPEGWDQRFTECFMAAADDAQLS